MYDKKYYARLAQELESNPQKYYDLWIQLAQYKYIPRNRIGHTSVIILILLFTLWWCYE